MKKVLVLFSCLYVCFAFCMQEQKSCVVNTGVFSDRGDNQFQKNRYDVKKLKRDKEFIVFRTMDGKVFEVAKRDAHSVAPELKRSIVNSWGEKKSSSIILAGLFGGHNGKCVSKMCKDDLLDFVAWRLNHKSSLINSLERAVQCCDNQCCSGEFEEELLNHRCLNSGTSLAVSAFLPTKKRLYVMYLGDVVAVLFDKKGLVHFSTPHRTTHHAVEKARIEYAGARITEKGCIEGKLPVSRAVGDGYFKNEFPGLILTWPDTFKINVQDFNYLILMSRDVYDAFDASSQESRVKDFRTVFFDAVALSNDDFKNKYAFPDQIKLEHREDDSDDSEDEYPLGEGLQEEPLDTDMNSIAEKIIAAVRARGCTDNATVIVQSFN